MFFSMLRLNELLGYGNEINAYLKTIDSEGLQIASAIEKLNKNVEKALAASNRAMSSQFTDQLHDFDIRRDESFVAFRNLMEASTHRKDEAVANAADKLCRIIRSHNWLLYHEGLKMQSAKMASLTQELDLEENQALIAILNATTWYTDMVDDNAAYNQLNEVKGKAKIDQIHYNTEEVYKALRFACEELFEAIEVLNRISPNEKYEEMAKFINNCTQKYTTVARTRKTRNENANTEEAEAS